MMSEIHIASDHAGVELKSQIIEFIKSNLKLTCIDHGPLTTDSVDYPDYANKVAIALKNKTNALGILICGSGQGMCLRANKFSYIRAALVYNDEIAKLSREHNNANIICLGARFCSKDEASQWIQTFINTPFSEGREAQRHIQRVAKISLPTT